MCASIHRGEERSNSFPSHLPMHTERTEGTPEVGIRVGVRVGVGVLRITLALLNMLAVVVRGRYEFQFMWMR
jgi:hypothetical protein